MLKTDPAPERVKLGFAETVLSSFDFLTKEYGFLCVKVEPTFVRYESPRVFVNVYHGRASYELGVEIGRLAKVPGEEEQFSIGDVIDLIGAREESDYTFFQASTLERVKKYVPKLAALVRKYAVAALKDETNIFEKLRKIQWDKSEEYLKEMRLNQIRTKSDQAWREKDYALLIKLYESVLDDLTTVEIKKLEYAKKQVLHKWM